MRAAVREVLRRNNALFADDEASALGDHGAVDRAAAKRERKRAARLRRGARVSAGEKLWAAFRAFEEENPDLDVAGFLNWAGKQAERWHLRLGRSPSVPDEAEEAAAASKWDRVSGDEAGKPR